MAVITFTTRYLLIHPKLPIRLGPKLSKFLGYSAPAVLTAIWVPIIFVHDGQLNVSITNPYFVAAFIAVITADLRLCLVFRISTFIVKLS